MHGMKLSGIHISTVSAVPQEYLMTLMPQRFARSRRYLRREDQLRCLGAGLLMHRVLGINEQDLRNGEFGKPYVLGGREFNLSHGGKWVILAEDSTPVGVDIEQILPWHRETARLVFTPQEQTWLKQQATDAAFYRLWTGKEAVMKALGLGFNLPPESFGIFPDAAGPNRVRGRTWYLHWQQIEGYMMCIASESDAEPPNLISLSQNELLADKL